MSNSLDPDQARHFVWPDLGPNCLQSFISTDDTSWQIVNITIDNQSFEIHFSGTLYISVSISGPTFCSFYDFLQNLSVPNIN